MDYSKLQNGSDIRGVALEGIEGQHVNLTESASRDIGRGFALWLQKHLGGGKALRVAVAGIPGCPVKSCAAGSLTPWRRKV